MPFGNLDYLRLYYCVIDMIEIPSQKEIHTVHGRQSNVQCIFSVFFLPTMTIDNDKVQLFPEGNTSIRLKTSRNALRAPNLSFPSCMYVPHPLSRG